MADEERITHDEIAAAVLNNETKRVGQILEEFGGLTKGEKTIHVTENSLYLMRVTLGLAVHMSMNDFLTGELALELISRTAGAIRLFPILRLIAACLGLEKDDPKVFEKIPDNIRKALVNNEYSSEIASSIKNLGTDATKALISFLLSSNIPRRGISKAFNYPILYAIYNYYLISDITLFTFMASHPAATFEESVKEALGEGGFTIMVPGNLMSVLMLGAALAEDIEAGSDDDGETSDGNNEAEPSGNDAQ